MICPHCQKEIKTERMTQEQTELVEKAFAYFWERWRGYKKSIDVKNTSSKATTREKFKRLFNGQYWAKHNEDDFRSEINEMCAYAKEGHNLEGFNPFTNMQTGRFLTSKGWRK